MVEQKIVVALKEVLKQISENRSEVSLFALLKMDELTEKWTVVLSAPWINNSTRDETFYQIRDLLLKVLSKDELQTIARIGLYETGEHLIELLIDRYNDGDYIASDEKVNGNLIHEGYILASKRLGVSQGKESNDGIISK